MLMQLRTLPANNYPDDKAETLHSQETLSPGETVTHVCVTLLTYGNT